MNILIITDNNTIYDCLSEIFIKYKDDTYNFIFMHSPSSIIQKHPDLSGKNLAICVDKDYEWIINNFDLVISAHCTQFFPKQLIDNVKCINIHPGYNPINRGWYPQVFSIVNNLEIGATIHEMDYKLDHGKIIDRKFVDKYVWDTSETLYKRVIEAEIELFEENFFQIISNNYVAFSPEKDYNFFSKNDFAKLCEIDITKQGSFSDFYNLLRALSHGEHKNAYFIDNETGKKVFVKIVISHE